MSVCIKSSQLESPNFAYIELSKQTLQKQLTVLFPASGSFAQLLRLVTSFLMLTAFTPYQR